MSHYFFPEQKMSGYALRALALAAFFLCAAPRFVRAKHSPPEQPAREKYQGSQGSDDATIEDLIKDRIDSEWKIAGKNFIPELMHTEADYARLSASSHDVLYAASFHLQPYYYNHASLGPDTNYRVYAEQPIMYYVGSARTPLALPVVSNLSKNLSGDEASYTVNIGILPLPDLTSSDSMRYFVVIEREIESNHTDNSVRLERFRKEFAAKIGEPVFLRFEDERPEKGAYIIKMENGNVLDFYDDFARFIEEHIILKSEPLSFGLGHETISDISERLSVPYSVARRCEVKVQLLSVVDTAHPLTIVDTVREPADYLAEVDMSKFADGPYQYRFTAIDPETGKALYSETHDFHKSAPVMFTDGSRLGPPDTLRVGGNQLDYAKLLSEASSELANTRVLNEQYLSTMSEDEKEKHNLELIVKSDKTTTIADVHLRAGLGAGWAAGDNFFVGIEANRPSLAFDISFGWMYGGNTPVSSPVLTTYTQMFQAPGSLGFQLSWIPVKLFGGLLEPLIGIANFDQWSSQQTSGVSSAALLGWQLGLACEPWGEVQGLGFSVSYSAAYTLGLTPYQSSNLCAKAYVRF